MICAGDLIRTASARIRNCEHILYSNCLRTLFEHAVESEIKLAT